MKIALVAVLAFLFLISVWLMRILHGIPVKELRRQARGQKNKKDAAIYKLAAFGQSSELFLWLVGALSAVGLILLAGKKAWWIGLIVGLLVLWLVWQSKPIKESNGWSWSIAALFAPVFSAVISFLQPILGRLPRLSKTQKHTGLYEKEDLMELLKMQGRQNDNRLSQEDLKIAGGALSFSDKTVGSIMTPRRQIKWVAAGESIGPMVMDELHKTGQIRFPVVKESTRAANPQVVGILYLQDLLDNLGDKGRIRDIMKSGAGFINESLDLRSALYEFLKSGQYLLIVVNNFEEVAGVLSFESLIEQILGKKLDDEFALQGDVNPDEVGKDEQSDSKPAKAKVE